MLETSVGKVEVRTDPVAVNCEAAGAEEYCASGVSDEVDMAKEVAGPSLITVEVGLVETGDEILCGSESLKALDVAESYKAVLSYCSEVLVSVLRELVRGWVDSTGSFVEDGAAVLSSVFNEEILVAESSELVSLVAVERSEVERAEEVVLTDVVASVEEIVGSTEGVEVPVSEEVVSS